MPEIFDASKDKKKKAHTSHTTTGSTSAADQPPRTTRHVDEYSSIMARHDQTSNPFNAFATKPLRTFFDTQNDGEEVLLLLRQHPITQLKWIIIAILLILAPALFSYVGFLNFLPPSYHFAAGIGWYLLVVGFSLEAFLDWFFNVYIITDERIVDIDFTSLIYKDISYAKIDKIEDITATTSGTLGALFDFGTVKIQTAGTVTEFDFENVPHPSRVTAFLNDMMIEEEREKIEGRIS